MKTTFAVLNDTHGNHKLGLCNPEVIIQQEDERGILVETSPTLTPVQKYLWRLYGQCLEAIKRISTGQRLIVLHNGDENQGNKHAADHVSAVLSDEIAIAVANLEPLFTLPNLEALRLADGTGAHNFLFGSSTRLVSKQLAANHPQVSVSVCHHGLLDIDGYLIDYAHHGPHPGGRTYLSGNTARLYLRDLMTREILAGRKPPDCVLRAHYHTPVHEVVEVNGFVSEIFIVPSFCGMDEHSRQATQSFDTMTFGMLALEIENGRKVADHRLYDTLDIRTHEKL